jgi:hypothetical protein
MTRIPPPPWAKPHEVKLREGISQSLYNTIQLHRPALTTLIHTEIEEYINDPSLCTDDPNMFPSQAVLSGNYYISRESYALKKHPLLLLGIQCQCLRKPWGTVKTESHYLGLHLWITCDPALGSFQISGNTDSSSQ